METSLNSENNMFSFTEGLDMPHSAIIFFFLLGPGGDSFLHIHQTTIHGLLIIELFFGDVKNDPWLMINDYKCVMLLRIIFSWVCPNPLHTCVHRISQAEAGEADDDEDDVEMIVPVEDGAAEDETGMGHLKASWCPARI